MAFDACLYGGAAVAFANPVVACAVELLRRAFKRGRCQQKGMPREEMSRERDFNRRRCQEKVILRQRACQWKEMSRERDAKRMRCKEREREGQRDRDETSGERDGM